jgi:transposase
MSGQVANGNTAVVLSTRRRWSEEEKQAILAEAAGGTRTVSEVARRHGLSRDLLFRWRRELRKNTAGVAKGSGSTFIAVSLPERARPCNGSLEIVLQGDRRVIVSKDADLVLLKQVIGILESR